MSESASELQQQQHSVNSKHAVNVKSSAGQSRLSLRKQDEDHYRMKLQHEARAKCEEKSVAFGKCVQDTGFLAVIKCRAQNTAMNNCLNENYNEDVFKKYVTDMGYDFDSKIVNNGLFK